MTTAQDASRRFNLAIHALAQTGWTREERKALRQERDRAKRDYLEAVK